MSTINKPSLAWLWLNWVTANATGVGLLWSCLVGSGQLLGIESGFGLIVVTIVASLIVIGFAQQLVLRPWVRYVDYWGLALPALLLLGCQVAAIPALLTSLLIGGLVESLVGKREFVLQGWIHLIVGWAFLGAGFSLVQTPYLSLTRKNALCWVLASGLGFATGVFGFGLCYYFVGYTLPMSVGVASLSGTVGGAIYGSITGTALVMMLRGHENYPVKMRY